MLVFGLPCFLLPSGVHTKTCRGILYLFILSVWPMCGDNRYMVLVVSSRSLLFDFKSFQLVFHYKKNEWNFWKYIKKDRQKERQTKGKTGKKKDRLKERKAKRLTKLKRHQSVTESCPFKQYTTVRLHGNSWRRLDYHTYTTTLTEQRSKPNNRQWHANLLTGPVLVSQNVSVELGPISVLVSQNVAVELGPIYIYYLTVNQSGLEVGHLTTAWLQTLHNEPGSIFT
jgi:hypothetical protein